MKATELIKILCDHIHNHGDQVVFFYGCGRWHPIQAPSYVEYQSLHICCGPECCDIPGRQEKTYDDIYKNGCDVKDYFCEGVFIG